MYSEIVPVSSREKFHIYNSWLISIYYDEKNIVRNMHYYDYAVFHYYCHKCGLVEVKKYNKTTCYLKNLYNHTCSNCSNNNFINVDNIDDMYFVYEKQYIESNDYYKAINIKHIPVKGEGISQSSVIKDIVTIYKDTLYIEYDNNRNTCDQDELGFYRYEIRYLNNLDLFLVENICKNINHKYFNFLDVTKDSKSTKYNLLGYFTDYLSRPKLQDYKLLFIEDSRKYNTIESYVKYILNGIETKSIKKQFYQKLDSSFNFNAFFVLCRVFEDINFIYSILNSYQNTRFFCQVESSIKFIKYLQKYYTDRQISNIITCNDNIQIIIDIFRLANQIYHTKVKFFYDNFQKVKSTTKHMHDELSRISHLLEDESLKVKFKYSKQELKKETKVEYLAFKLPKNGLELTQWATILNNCMAGYVNSIKYKETIIYGVFDNNTLQFAVEIREGRLIQASGKNNSQLEPEEQEILDMWIRRFFRYENGVGIAA